MRCSQGVFYISWSVKQFQSIWQDNGRALMLPNPRESHLSYEMDDLDSAAITNTTSRTRWTSLDNWVGNAMLFTRIWQSRFEKCFQSIRLDDGCALVLSSPRAANWVHIAIARPMIWTAQRAHKRSVDRARHHWITVWVMRCSWRAFWNHDSWSDFNQSLWWDDGHALVLPSPREAMWVHIAIARWMIWTAQRAHKQSVDHVGYYWVNTGAMQYPRFAFSNRNSWGDLTRCGRTMVMHQCYPVLEKQCDHTSQLSMDDLDRTAISIATHLEHWPTPDNCDSNPMLSMCMWQSRSVSHEWFQPDNCASNPMLSMCSLQSRSASRVIPTGLIGRWSCVGATKSPRSNVSAYCSARSIVWTE